ncbi:hypothetical protein C8Q78DRAFT_1078937 [Trametes maxima]|nr:hypothetical protein C8Q78DRAFT_1078937 [Trametes maxima]
MTTINILPEELLDAILREALTLPSSSFLAWSAHYTYGTTVPSTVASVLLVCKAWARIGQPYLYEGVILRRNAQAEALARTLGLFPSPHSTEGDAGDLNAPLGQRAEAAAVVGLAAHIRRLRIDAVQCAAVERVLRAATRVRELHLSLAVSPRGPAVDWLGAFRCVSPRVLYLQDTMEMYKNNERMIDAVEDMLCVRPGTREGPIWSELREVHMRDMDFSVMPGIGRGLSVLPTLELVTASNAWVAEYWKQFVALVSNNVHVRAIYLEHASYSPTKHIMFDGRGRNITYQGPFDLSTVCVPKSKRRDAGPHNAPVLSTAARFPDSVWRHIFSYALVGCAPGDYYAIEANSTQWLRQRSRAHRPQDLLCVSKKFKIIAEPLLHVAPVLYSARAAEEYSALLRRRPELGRHVRVLARPQMRAGEIDATPLPAEAVPNLRICYGTRLGPCDGWDGPRSRGGGRAGVHLGADPSFGVGAAFFAELPWLERLSLCGCVVRCPAPGEVLEEGALPRLRKLSLSLDGVIDTLLTLAPLNLPSLEELEFRGMDGARRGEARAAHAFVAKHGQKLKRFGMMDNGVLQYWEDAPLALCPDLESLEVFDVALAGINQVVTTSKPHHHLKVLSLPYVEFDTRRPSRYALSRPRFLQHVNLEMLTELREIRLPIHCVWPGTE